MAKTFFVSEQQNLFPQHMFPARLNWETMFPSLASSAVARGGAGGARAPPVFFS